MHLATHLLHDAHMGACEVAVVVSNDSDRLEPITIVRGHLGKNVGVLNPQKHPSRAMLPHIDFIKQIRHGTLHAAQRALHGLTSSSPPLCQPSRGEGGTTA